MAAYARRMVRFIDGRVDADEPNLHPVPPAAVMPEATV
jgi:putative ABC transport system ATP-binding protein